MGARSAASKATANLHSRIPDLCRKKRNHKLIPDMAFNEHYKLVDNDILYQNILNK